MNLEDRLKNHLQEQNQRAVVAGAGSASAMSRSQQRRRRSTGMVAALMLFVTGIVGASVFALNSGDDGPTSEIAAEGEDNGGELNNDNPRGEEEATEAEGDAASEEANATSTLTATVAASASDVGGYSNSLFVTNQGVYYSLSTVPGEQPFNGSNEWVEPDQAIYRSADGSSWTHAAQEGSWIARLDEKDGVLYALGTTPGTQEQNLIAATSNDDGQSWSRTVIELVPPAATLGSIPQTSGLSSSMAVGDQGVLVAATTSSYPEFWQMLTADEQNAGYGMEPRPEGLAVVDFSDADYQTASNVFPCEEFEDFPEAELEELMEQDLDFVAAMENCVPFDQMDEILPPVVSVTPWADLGTTYAEVTGPQSTNSELFLSTDGGASFAAVAWPFGDVWLSGLQASSNGFLASTVAQDNNNNGGTIWTSTDGLTWAASPAPIQDLASFGEADGQMLAVDWSGNVARSTDAGATWTSNAPVDGNNQNQWVVDSDVSAQGVALLVDVFNQSEGAREAINIEDGQSPEAPEPDTFLVYFSADGVDWQSVDISAVVEDLQYAWGVTFGPNGIKVHGTVLTADGPQSQVISVDLS